jgi:hypothetical protein
MLQKVEKEEEEGQVGSSTDAAGHKAKASFLFHVQHIILSAARFPIMYGCLCSPDLPHLLSIVPQSVCTCTREQCKLGRHLRIVLIASQSSWNHTQS